MKEENKKESGGFEIVLIFPEKSDDDEMEKIQYRVKPKKRWSAVLFIMWTGTKLE